MRTIECARGTMRARSRRSFALAALIRAAILRTQFPRMATILSPESDVARLQLAYEFLKLIGFEEPKLAQCLHQAGNGLCRHGGPRVGEATGRFVSNRW